MKKKDLFDIAYSKFNSKLEFKMIKSSVYGVLEKIIKSISYEDLEDSQKIKKLTSSLREIKNNTRNQKIGQVNTIDMKKLIALLFELQGPHYSTFLDRPSSHFFYNDIQYVIASFHRWSMIS